MQRRAAEESLTDHGKDNSNGRAHVGDAIRHKPGILGFLRQIGFMGATGVESDRYIGMYVIPSSIEGDSFRGFPNGKKSESMRRTDTEVRHGQSGCVTGRF